MNPLTLAATITLAGVQGRIDHLAVDIAHERLFLAALGNNTVEVIDVKAGKRIHTIPGLQEPQGLLYLRTATGCTSRVAVTVPAASMMPRTISYAG